MNEPILPYILLCEVAPPELVRESERGQKLKTASVALKTNVSRLDRRVGMLLIAYIESANEFIKNHDPRCSGCPGMRMHQVLSVKAQAMLDVAEEP